MCPILFKIGPVPIRAYGFMLWVAIVVGLIRTLRASRSTDIKPEHVVDVVIYSLIVGIVAAHLASILLDLKYYNQYPRELLGLWKGAFSESGGLRGLSFHGGLIGGLATAWLYARRKQINFLALADLCSPALALSYGIARIGCFLNGCCYGRPTNLPWAVQFHLDPISDRMTPPSHPTQLYAFAASIVIFYLLTRVEKRRCYIGQVFLIYLALYSIYRFLIEFLRKGVTADIVFVGITEAQLVSLVVLAVVLPLLWSRRRVARASILAAKKRSG
ncbi:MAG: prolipoprotein diacylglyceryl transferase [Armatimonadota bacterium]